MPRRTASCVAFIHIHAGLLLLLIFPKLAVYLWPTERERERGRGVAGEGVPKPPRLTIFQAPKFSYGLCPSSYAHTMRKRERERKKGEGKTKRKLYGLNVNENEKFRQNSYEYEYPSSRAKPTSITQYQQHQQNKLKTSSLWGTWVIQSVLVTRDSLIYHHTQNISEKIWNFHKLKSMNHQFSESMKESIIH